MIIGLSGYATAGKSEAARGLETIGFKTIAFADKLRDFLFTLNPFVAQGVRLRTVVSLYGWQGVKNTFYGPEVRRLLQVLGTDCGRALISDNVWVDATLDGLDSENYAIADVRFPNEAQAIVDRGGVIVRIDKPGVGPLNDHESETAMDRWNYDYYIFNDGDVEELHSLVQSIAAIKAHL